MTRQVLHLLEERDLIEQVLEEAEGAHPAADETAEEHPEETDAAEDVEREFIRPAVQHRLQRADRAGTHRARAGVAVQTRQAKLFVGAGIDFPFRPAVSITVGEGNRRRLKPVAQIRVLFLCGFYSCIHRLSDPNTFQTNVDGLVEDDIDFFIQHAENHHRKKDGKQQRAEDVALFLTHCFPPFRYRPVPAIRQTDRARRPPHCCRTESRSRRRSRSRPRCRGKRYSSSAQPDC